MTTKTPVYKIELNIGKNTYKTSGKTLLEALQKVKPKDYIGWGNILVTHGGKESKIPLKLVPAKLKVLFEKDIEMQLFAKRLSTLI
jgi:hypothetical protein